jgi:hypothetical protein
MKLKIRTDSHASPWLVLALFGVLALAGFLAVWGCESRQSDVLDIQATDTRSSEGKQQGGKLFDPSDAMTEAIQDEYHARFTYLKVLVDLGSDTGPFDNIVEAEKQHVDAIFELFIAREWEIPESAWTLDNVPTFATRVEACLGGVDAENENIDMYDELLTLDLPLDVEEVFVNLQAASFEHHLPAFEACSVPGPIDAMDVAIQDEYHAEATYAKVLADLGDITPFNTIVLAEVQHVASMAGLYDSRDLPIPQSQWTEVNVPTFESRTEACVGGVQAEQENIGMYGNLLELPDLPNDVLNVFENLRSASLYHHLPAFKVCATVVHQPSEYLLTAIQHEYKLNAMYAKVLVDLGEIDPFANIVTAEAQHVSELATLIENKGGDVPASQWDDTNVPTFSGQSEACTMALAEEIVNRAMYDGFLLELGLAPDVREVFERLRAATDESHIPALTECAL